MTGRAIGQESEDLAMSTELVSIFRKAANGKRVVPDDWMPTSRVRPFILGDPGEVWLEFHGESQDLKPDLPSPYSFFDFIVEKGKEFKGKWIQENAKRASRVCEETYHVRYADKVRKTLELMLVEKAPVIVEPALWWAPERIYGVPDLLVHTAWLKDHFPNAWQELQSQAEPGQEPEGYVIFEMRFTTLDGDKQTRDSLKVAEAQIRLNTYILGQLQGWMPQRGFLITRDRVDDPLPIAISSGPDQPLDDDLAKIRDQFFEIKTHGAEYTPWEDEIVVSDVARGDGRWQDAKGLIAWEKTPGGDPRALYRIGATQKQELAGKGYDSIDAMLQDAPSAVPLEEMTGIGAVTGKEIRAILQANRTGAPVLPKPEAVPLEKEFEFFVDFEFLSNLNVDIKKEWPILTGREMLFMIGVGWEEGGEWQFEVFVAAKENREQERKMIEAFIEFLKEKTDGAFTDAKKTAIYHWTSAEKSQSTRAARRLGLPADHAFRQLPWVDLHKSFKGTPCGVPGAWGYGLKSVAKALGKLDAAYDPQWVGVLDDGLGAMVMGWKAYENSRPTTCDEMKILKQYLEADCKALWCILSWMRAGHPGLPFGASGQTYVGWEKVKKGFSRPETEQGFAAFNGGKGVFVYLQPVLGKRTGIKKVQHLIWGDWVSVLESQADWRRITSRGTLGWVHKRFVQTDRLLEVNFVDVGQGDGCFIATPEDEYILIDAGQEDHMYRFLRWRFRHFQFPITFKAAIITHPDKDHYYGFRKFFDKKDKAVQNVEFECIYHNGIVERKSKDLGASAKDAQGDKFLTEVVADQQALEGLLSATKGGGTFLRLIRNAHDSGRVEEVRMLGAGKSEPTFMPGYEANRPLSIQVLAPVPEGPPGELHLRWFDNDAGKTKNGHSVVLRLKYGLVRMLLGGDLNIPAEEYLLGHYGGIDKPFDDLSDDEKKAMIEKAREFFGSDIAKSCHHGSADVSSEFLRAVAAVATVVSSGDDEPHSHPRPEALGTLGKYGRGDRPLIFSTELARSTKENVKHTYILHQRHEKAVKEDRETEFIEGLIQELGRSVAVYGMITLRTDGQQVLIAQKLEQPGSGGRKWELHLLSPDEAGRLQYESKHE
jgi:beta-lactamase superfamily II metal-dependent hydrolase